MALGMEFGGQAPITGMICRRKAGLRALEYQKEQPALCRWMTYLRCDGAAVPRHWRHYLCFAVLFLTLLMIQMLFVTKLGQVGYIFRRRG